MYFLKNRERKRKKKKHNGKGAHPWRPGVSLKLGVERDFPVSGPSCLPLGRRHQRVWKGKEGECGAFVFLK